jgi:hypothetical protein
MNPCQQHLREVGSDSFWRRCFPIALRALLGGCLLLAGSAGAATRYVDLNNAAPALPYTSWATAATNIQDAVDIAEAGDEILVTNGVYQTGAREVYGMSNRVAVTKPVTLRSVNGPAVTQIMGYQVPGTTHGPEAVRCVYLTNGAVLAGFTLTNGATQTSGDFYRNRSGGGVWCEGLDAVVSNCVVTGNSALHRGGGAYSGMLNNSTLTGNFAASEGGGANSGTLNNCTLTGNFAYSGGGAYGATLTNCTLTGNSGGYYGGGASGGTLNNCMLAGNSALFGGGARSATLNNCVLAGNSAREAGGGASGGTLNNCMLTGNSAYSFGGGAYWGRLNNCTLTGNSAGDGGGASAATLNNCIVYYNMAANGANYGTPPDHGSIRLDYCCTIPLPTNGLGNMTNAPSFLDTNGWSDLRLQTNSPCINTGNNAYAPSPTDLDGNPRIAGTTVDIGAYEFQGDGLSGFTAWLWQYGLPIDGSADAADPDQDRMNNCQEWVAGTNPTNAASALRMLPVTGAASDVRVSWTSVTNRSYALERATNLGVVPAFSLLQSNLAGWPGTTSCTDTNAAGSAPRFYRVRVEP